VATGTERAFDAHHPPQLDLIEDCVHCGFCLPTCPTYALWGEEMDSPRGRIVLMRNGLEEGSELSAPMITHFDRCLGCMACVTACPSGVQYDKLIEDTRAQVERNFPRSRAQRIARRLIFEGFTHPARMRASAPLLAAYRRTGLDRVVGSSGVLDRFPRLRALEQLSPDVPLHSTQRRLPEAIRPRGERRARVGMLQGCVQRVFFGDVNVATARVLQSEGFELHVPRRPRCCGALMLHTGVQDEAIVLAKANIEAFEGCDYVAVNSAGCGSSMKDYGHVMRDEPGGWAERAAAFSARVRDVHELLAAFGPIAPRRAVPMRVAYHDACHLAHAQGVRSQPRELLRAIPGMEVLEPEGWEICCGSAGIWNILEPEAGGELGRRKAEKLLATGAEGIASANPGCTLQITAHLKELGRPLPVYHPMELLWMSIEGKGR